MSMPMPTPRPEPEAQDPRTAGNTAQAIVITKSSNLERIGAKVKVKVDHGLIPASVYDNFVKAHDQHYAAIKALKESLEARGISYREVSRSEALDCSGVSAVFSVGGDGTLLAATDKVTGAVPVIGIKSSDTSIGYLCAADRHRIPEAVEAFATGGLTYTPRKRMAAQIYHEGIHAPSVVTVPVLNDFLFANSHPAATSRYVLRVGEAEEDQKSSGIWLATPSGSTAGIMAAGGEPQDSVKGQFQYLVREMYKGDEVQRLLRGGTFVPGKDVLTITNLNPEGILALDGSKICYDLHLGSVVTFVAAEPALIAAPLPL